MNKYSCIKCDRIQLDKDSMLECEDDRPEFGEGCPLINIGKIKQKLADSERSEKL